MTNSIITTAFNRPAWILETALRSALHALPEAKVVIVDDGSAEAYSARYRTLAADLGATYRRVDTSADRPGTYSIDGTNNPAYAWNVAHRTACDLGADRCLILSSDCELQSGAREMLRFFDVGSAVWTCRVIDMDSTSLYHGPERVRPFPWAMYTSTQAVTDIGGWDEEYLQGIAFEDNDFSARLLIEVGRVIVRGEVIAWHHSHPQLAYSDGMEGWRRNEEYTKAKWGGVVPINEQGAVRFLPITQGQSFSADCYRGPSVLEEFLRDGTDGCTSVVELGAMFGWNLGGVAKSVTRKLAVEIHRPYIDQALREGNRTGAEWVQADIREWVRTVEPGAFDAALLIDVIEHMDHNEGEALLRECQSKFGRVLVFTPDGFIAQEHDHFSLGGDEWQTHRCGWTVDELKALGFQGYSFPRYHNLRGVKAGAIFAGWRADQ